MARPAAYLNWVPSGNPAYIQQPPTGQSNTGWLGGQPPPFQYDNYALYILDQWVQYLDAAGAGGSYVTVTSAYAPEPPVSVIFANATAGGFTITLPSPALQPGYQVAIVNVGSANSVTVVAASGNINGSASVTIAPGGTLTFKNDGTNYWELVTAVSDWPNFFAASESDLSTAITSAGIAGGGIICLTTSFSITASHIIPAGTVLVGRYGGTVITVTSGGSLTLATGAIMEKVWFQTSLTSGAILNLSNNYSTVRNCQFTIPNTSTGAAILVSGNSNKMYNCVFFGVLDGDPGYGINYSAGAGNEDYDSVFFP
jgi:hypothetical protein